MSRLESLPADQRAVLQLLLRQGKSYGDLAGLLRISDETVRARALAALDALSPTGAEGVSDHRRDEIGDYLLGQQTASQRAGTRAYLEDSAAARGWARGVAKEIRSLTGDDQPDIPADGPEVDEAFEALDARRSAGERQQRSSRLGGILLLLGLVAAVAVVVVIILSGGDDNSGDSAAVTTPGGSTSTATTTTSSSQPKVIAQINMTPPGGGRKPLGVANVVAQGGQNALAIAAQDLPPTTTKRFYAVWLYSNPAKSQRLGFGPPVTANGKFQAVAKVPTNFAQFGQLIITVETDRDPKQPGKIILTGKLTA